MNVEPLEGQDRLAGLQKEERTVSLRRTRLHQRLDFLRAGRGGDADAALIEELEREEQELSRRRGDLHERIERLSAPLSSERRSA